MNFNNLHNNRKKLIAENIDKDYIIIGDTNTLQKRGKL